MVYWIIAGIILVAAVMVVVFLIRRKGAPKYDIYQHGEYHPSEETAKGPGPQRPLSGPGGTPIGFP